MAFNPLHTFQRNRRFWMAAILMICMVSFVFCTGMRGDMADKIIAWTTGRSGPSVISIDGRSVSDRDLEDLRMQRNLANSFMRICSDMAHKKLVKRFYDVSKKQAGDKEAEARQQEMGLLLDMRRAIDERRAKPRYFDIGVKFDDLVEFKLWQAEADRLGIRLESEHIDFLFKMEFFFDRILSSQEISFAQQQAKRDNHRDASDAFIHRAIGEEFRVKIAQYVVLGFQPYSFIQRRKRDTEGFMLKFSDPAMPDETRSLMTLAHLFEYYKAKRSEFEVTLIPVNVEDFVKKMKDEPTEDEKRTFFNAHKDKPYDPATDVWGLEIPTRIKIEYVYADTNAPYYLGKAKVVAALNATNSLAFDTGFGLMARHLAIADKNRADLQNQYNAMVSKNKEPGPDDRYRAAALNSDRDIATPVLAFMASRSSDPLTRLLSASALAPIDGFGLAGPGRAGMQLFGAATFSPLDGLSTFVARPRANHWIDHELTQTPPIDWLSSGLAQAAARHRVEVEDALHSEMIRRTPIYRDIMTWVCSGNPLTLVGPLLSIDPALTNVVPPEMEAVAAKLGIKRVTHQYIHPLYTVETVRPVLREMIDQHTAEEWAQEKMLALRVDLEKAKGDAQYRRVLNSKEVRAMHLTYGPPDDQKAKYYDRFDINDAEEFKVLKEAYLKYLNMINLFEGRDVSLGGVLKPTDYPKMFFDGTESFSVASALYGVMPWPPDVKASTVRDPELANPRLVDPNNLILADKLRFQNHIAATDPNLVPPKLELFKTAARPILFWRSAEILAQRPTDYDKIGRDINDFASERAKVEEGLKKNPGDTILMGKKAELERSEGDLKKILSRITEGLKFERARSNAALPEAKKIALTVLDFGEKADAGMRKEAERLSKLINEGTPGKADNTKLPLILLPKLSDMHQEEFAGRGKDYFPPPLPKDERIKFPRDDMMKQILSLYDLKSGLKTGTPDPDDASKIKPVDPDLDAINKELFERVTKDPKQGKFVQILTNKSRSIYFVAAITVPPNSSPRAIAFTENEFTVAMKGARFPEDFNPKLMGMRDHFVERAQEEAAQVYRAQVIESLRLIHNVGTVDPDVKKKFDGRGAGD